MIPRLSGWLGILALLAAPAPQASLTAHYSDQLTSALDDGDIHPGIPGNLQAAATSLKSEMRCAPNTARIQRAYQLGRPAEKNAGTGGANTALARLILRS